jgi:hypothetical protein
MNDAHRALPKCSSLMTTTLCVRPAPPRTISAMFGRQTADQAQLFYEFCLEDRVPPNHLRWRIKLFVSVALTLELRGDENVPTGTL